MTSLWLMIRRFLLYIFVTVTGCINFLSCSLGLATKIRYQGGLKFAVYPKLNTRHTTQI